MRRKRLAKAMDYEQKRRHQRFEFSELVDYYLNPELKDPVCAVSVNISESGLCLYTPKSVSVGQNVILKTSLKSPYVKANVRWVKKYLEDLYKVGLLFLE